MTIASAQQAGAAYTITQTEDFAFVPNGSRELTFAKFDDLGGTRILQSVEIIVGYTKSGGSLAVDNDSEVGGVIDLQHAINANLIVLTGGVSLLDLAFDPIGSGLDAISAIHDLGIGPTTGDPTNEFNNTGLEDYFLFTPDPLAVSDSGKINPLLQSTYIAALDSGTFSLDFRAIQTTNATGLGGLQQAFVVSDVEGSVTVRYNYEVIPEPSSMLLGLSALGLILRRRR